jgi:hypothetical protein
MPQVDSDACRACGGPTSPLWKGDLLDLNVDYMRCSSCGYVQTEYPYWLDRAYAESINDSDTGIMARNQSNVRIVLATLLAIGKLDDRVVDFAGGYGILTRLLRDIGVDALWSDSFSKNLLARGFEHKGESAGLITAFESFEHFVDPGMGSHRMYCSRQRSFPIPSRVSISGGTTAENTVSTSDFIRSIPFEYSPRAGMHI